MEIVSSLATAVGLLGDLAAKLKGGQKEQVELLKQRLDLAKDHVEVLARERDALKQQVVELNHKVRELEEKDAYREVAEDFRVSKYSGLLFKSMADGKEDGPYCPKDKSRMTRQSDRNYRCPSCGNVAEQ